MKKVIVFLIAAIMIMTVMSGSFAAEVDNMITVIDTTANGFASSDALGSLSCAGTTSVTSDGKLSVGANSSGFQFFPSDELRKKFSGGGILNVSYDFDFGDNSAQEQLLNIFTGNSIDTKKDTKILEYILNTSSQKLRAFAYNKELKTNITDADIVGANFKVDFSLDFKNNSAVFKCDYTPKGGTTVHYEYFCDDLSSIGSNDGKYDKLTKEPIQIIRGFFSKNSVVNRLKITFEDTSKDGEELYVYERADDESANSVHDISLVMNKDGVEKNGACAIFASYSNGMLKDVKPMIFSGSIKKGTILGFENVGLNLTDADTFKIFLLDVSGSLTPITKNITQAVKPTVYSSFYPGWTKKAVTFSYDDGNASADDKMTALLRDANMKATFNLVTNWLDTSSEDAINTVRARYEGFDVASHSKYHPYPYSQLSDEAKADYEPYDAVDENGNTFKLYKHKEENRFYAEEDEYIKCVDAGHVELERIFGEGSDTAFAWPGPGYGQYYTLKNHVTGMYALSRQGMNLTDATFALPSSWINWKYNADETCSLDRANEYAALSLSDSDTVRWICYGVHPYDYFSTTEKTENFKSALDVLKNKPDTYWYATNIEVYKYTEAQKKLEVTDEYVKNNSDMTLYIKINGTKTEIAPGAEIKL